MSIPNFIKTKQNKEKSSWITCYDFSSAKIVAQSDITGVLIGDSVVMTLYGHDTTLTATTELIAQHTEAVAKGLRGSKKIIIADMPFLSFRGSLDRTLKSVETLMKAGAHGVKIEGALGNLTTISSLVESGIPVMGHLGLTPQSLHSLGGFKVQGKDSLAQKQLLQQASDLEKAGCFALVLECVPSSLGLKITETVQIPVIGIGAGPATDGQILVWQDLLGIPSPYSPKFVRAFGQQQKETLKSLQEYHECVTTSQFPSQEESYG
jgi:3-methyl-2-oxobutanoate hydroxymethyltransferase